MATKRWTWMRVERDGENIVIVDCGYLSDDSARDRASRIFALGVGKKNLVWGPTTGGDPRIHVHIPPAKVQMVLTALPIIDRRTWFGTTHSFQQAEE